MGYGQWSEAGPARPKNRYSIMLKDKMSEPKAKRVKEVYPEKMVAHLWAHQTQEHARNGRGTFYFRGSTIYSYGSHFPIATIMPKRGKREACVLVTTRTYSNTTSGHCHAVRMAIPKDMKRFNVEHPDGCEFRHAGDRKKWARGELKTYRERIAQLAATAKKARDYPMTSANSAIGLWAEAHNFAAHFGVKFNDAQPFDAEELAKLQEKQDALDEARPAKEAARAAKRQAKWEARSAEWRRQDEERARRMALQDQEDAATRDERQKAWLAGESVELRRNDFADGVRLRVRGSRVETSMGAVAEISDCRPMLASLRAAMLDLASYNTDLPVSVGAVSKWGDANLLLDLAIPYVRIGCHDIPVPEIERLAQLLGE